MLIALFAWWYNSGGDQANNLAKTRNRGISGEAGDSSRDHGGLQGTRHRFPVGRSAAAPLVMPGRLR